jgi:hypothetical protein
MNKCLRVLYRMLLALHPSSFRREFSAEILRDFDGILALQGPISLFTDALLSLARQWAESEMPNDTPASEEFSLLGGCYVAMAQNRLTLFDLMRGSVLSTTLFLSFGTAASPDTIHALTAYLHSLL